ncbi:uncharacterized protein MYCGRDRAFT_93424 [Zymoseptoria tritici IPO323]|uniref:Uncharacterized protein n=1 Tax=Zymoseptoria tritici (strain CBS 115943 / IPO323) TaxID=336722 RepID=F9XBU4_ZYMTI|nr:uncharacterized protein MYCGRDRAFT_93424 [Zymoseptoria tritici IPO323]EGP87282.1 hypothetical protein MYCGRDRAFT_93424 [Zymoseptoria tritici IPO323]
MKRTGGFALAVLFATAVAAPIVRPIRFWNSNLLLTSSASAVHRSSSTCYCCSFGSQQMPTYRSGADSPPAADTEARIESNPPTRRPNSHGVEPLPPYEGGHTPADLAARDQVATNDGTKCPPSSQGYHGSVASGHNPTPHTRPCDHAGSGGGSPPDTAALEARKDNFDPYRKMEIKAKACLKIDAAPGGKYKKNIVTVEPRQLKTSERLRALEKKRPYPLQVPPVRA